jgi:hypothetical protein
MVVEPAIKAPKVTKKTIAAFSVFSRALYKGLSVRRGRGYSGYASAYASAFISS